MDFTITWFRSEEILSTDRAEIFFEARDIAKSRLASHLVRSGATHATVQADGGALMFDSRADKPLTTQRPGLAAALVRRIRPGTALAQA